MRRLTFVPFAIAATAIAATAIAMTAPASAETPQSTSATYQDWLLQCEIKDGTPAQKVCVISQTTQMQNKAQPFSRVVVEKPVKGHPVRLGVQLPVNVSIAGEVRVQSSATDAGIVAPFDLCVPAGCIARFDIKEDILQKFRAAEGMGKITFKDAGAHDINVPLSFKGFRQALDALTKE